MPDLLKPTRLLDFDSDEIENLLSARKWRELDERSRIRAAYDFVRNEIPFGYNESDDLPASRVLRDGYGQCNTKATLLMALLRALGIGCRLHGFTVHKELQRGIVPELFYWLAPDEILHSWVEIEREGRWLRLEGFIVDDEYLDGVRRLFPNCSADFCGFAIATDRLADPPVKLDEGDTFIQRQAIVRDFGVYDSPDDFYRDHGVNFHGWRAWLFQRVVRPMMNARVEAARRGQAQRLFGAASRERFVHSHAR